MRPRPPIGPTVEIALGQAADRGGIQVSRRGGRAAGSCRRGCGVERLGDLRIGVRACEREMVCPRFHVGRHLGQAQVPMAPFVHARLRVGTCGEQRVSERDTSLRHPDQAGFDCRIEQRLRGGPERGFHERGRRLRGRGRHEEGIARSRG